MNLTAQSRLLNKKHGLRYMRETRTLVVSEWQRIRANKHSLIPLLHFLKVVATSLWLKYRQDALDLKKAKTEIQPLFNFELEVAHGFSNCGTNMRKLHRRIEFQKELERIARLMFDQMNQVNGQL